ncbi:hypothetical protein PHET_06514 [Paragonimus heterotremus]|uniref:Lipocalin n=1 Tax=Paragonimus heterotremus TaxID=100268 RepID=A0A8J4WHG1_9TREM|nr:hypothetical protein PHET_06514 [Paragonimus heterotremus]
MIIYAYCEMAVLPVTIVLLALLRDVSAQNGTLPRKLTSTFKGALAYNSSLVEHPENLTQENRTKLQTDVCKQLIHLVPWYREQCNTSNCTVDHIDRNWVFVNYTILTTEKFLRIHDPSCSTYYILLANLVRPTRDYKTIYYLRHITLENGDSGQPAVPSSVDSGSTAIGVDGAVTRSGKQVSWIGFVLDSNVTKEVDNNVSPQS